MVRPWLWLPPKLAHDFAPYALPLWSQLFGSGETPTWRSHKWNDLEFKNPLGIAGGVDKNAQCVEPWWRLGCGFLEIGTITPEPQRANAGQVILRNTADLALWNKLGFPSHGVKAVKSRLSQLKRPYKTPLFANIGKNRTTSNQEAHKDYEHLVRELEDIVDAFVINISSPNTPGLRHLADKESLVTLVSACRQARQKDTPLLLKLSPDMKPESLCEALDTALEHGVSGFILTNTTTQRDTASSFPAEGGVSGQPLKKISIENLNHATRYLQTKYDQSKLDQPLIISAGGVLNCDDVHERLNSGAHLVQVYTAIVFNGPMFFINCKP